MSHRNMDLGTNVTAAEGGVSTVKIENSEYQAHLDAIMGTLTLNPDDVKLSVMAVLEPDGTQRVWVRGNAANATVSESIEVEPEWASQLSDALEAHRAAITYGLTLAVAKTMLGMQLEGRG